MVFCDWLSCYQEHPKGGLPVLNNGCVAQFEADAIKQFIDPQTGQLKTIFDATQIEWTTQKAFEFTGSYDTKIRIKCDGFRVSFDGNVSRFGRTDNVFGYSVVQCIALANKILVELGLPPFEHKRSAPFRDSFTPSGCIITRVDLTTNYSAGSHQNAVRLIHYFAGQDVGRRANAKQYGENGVSWNEGSKFWYSKMYIKSESLGEHAVENVKSWTIEQGIVRHEISLKSRYLTQNGLRSINDWLPRNKTDMFKGESMENIIYGRFDDVLKRGTATRTPLEDIPKVLGRIARDWRQGIDVYHDTNYGVSTRRRWRKQLLQYGIDIKLQSSVTRLPIRLQVVELQKCEAPDWYWSQSAA
ncbi:MAG TPA: phage/plasmid replication protein [Methylophilaceae bacterium]|jgi:hypothetical protein